MALSSSSRYNSYKFPNIGGDIASGTVNEELGSANDIILSY
jgi:hypothetical protein